MNDSLEIFPWNDNFNTDIVVIDEQHQEIVRLLNILARHMAYQSDSPASEQVFEELANYALHHFKTEEAIWAHYFADDDWVAAHQKNHERFVQELLLLKNSAFHESYDEAMEAVVAFLVEWLAFHILDQDKRMAQVVVAMQQGMDLAEAKNHAAQGFDKAMKVLIEAILQMYQNLSARTVQFLREAGKRQQAELKLRLADRAIASTLDAVVITDVELNIIQANPAFCQACGYDEYSLRGNKLGDKKPYLADAIQSARIWQSLAENGHWSGEIWNVNAEGKNEPEWLTFSAIKDEQQISHYVAIFSSISELAKRQQQLEGMANHDPLTGLPNRRLLMDRLQQALANAKRDNKMLAVCYLDLDGFKPINDTQGHAAGDRLLQEIAQRFKGVLREHDTVARLGGDEFVLLFASLSTAADVFSLLDRVMAIVSLPVKLEQTSVHVSASMGVSFFPNHGYDPAILLHTADQALYQAKNSGKSKYCLAQMTNPIENLSQATPSEH